MSNEPTQPTTPPEPASTPLPIDLDSLTDAQSGWRTDPEIGTRVQGDSLALLGLLERGADRPATGRQASNASLPTAEARSSPPGTIRVSPASAGC